MNEDFNVSEELRQLKEQYDYLKAEVDKQKIVNDDIFKATLKKNVGITQLDRNITFVSGLVLFPIAVFLCCIKGIPLDSSLLLCGTLAVYIVATFLFYRKYDVNKMISNDVLTNTIFMKQFKNAYKWFVLIAWSVALIVVCLFIPEIYGSWNFAGRGIYAVSILFLGVFSCMVGQYLTSKRVLDACDLIIDTLKNYDEKPI